MVIDFGNYQPVTFEVPRLNIYDFTRSCWKKRKLKVPTMNNSIVVDAEVVDVDEEDVVDVVDVEDEVAEEEEAEDGEEEAEGAETVIRGPNRNPSSLNKRSKSHAPVSFD